MTQKDRDNLRMQLVPWIDYFAKNAQLALNEGRMEQFRYHVGQRDALYMISLQLLVGDIQPPSSTS